MLLLPFRFIYFLLRLLIWPFFWFRWKRAARKNTYLELEIDGAVADIPAPPTFLSRFRKQPVSLSALSDVIEIAESDPRIAGYIVSLRSFRQGMASAISLYNLLGKAGQNGRELIVFLPFGGETKDLLIASAANRIIAAPQTTLSPLGFNIAARYVRGALDRIGLVPEVYARGIYKSAGEPLIRTSMSEREREQLDAILDELYARFEDALAKGRKIPNEKARELIDNAPYFHNEAVSAGLIDKTAYEDELPDTLKTPEKEPVLVPAAAYLRAKRRLQLPRLFPKPVIGVLPIHGAIATENPITAELGMATDEKIISAIRLARMDPYIRAVILHINSPGGSALASDRIHHELQCLALEKPLIAYMSNVAASGGYYVAAAAKTIVAQSTTMTGSIGVVATRLVIDPFLEKLGITSEVLKRGAHADMIEPTRALREDEKTILEREIDGIYKGFLQVVADGRKQPLDQIEKIAEGRVWIGTDAKKVGLVDEIGGFETALSAARNALGKGAETLRPMALRLDNEFIPPLDPPEKKAAQIISGISQLLSAAHGLGNHAQALTLSLHFTALLMGGERVLVFCPRTLELAGGEILHVSRTTAI